MLISKQRLNIYKKMKITKEELKELNDKGEDVKNYIKEEFGKDIEIKVIKRLGFSIGIKE